MRRKLASAPERHAPIRMERNEVKMPAAINPTEFVGHGEESPKLRPFKAERVGHPEKRNQSLGVDVLEWYHSNATRRQEEKSRTGGPPANGWNIKQVNNIGNVVEGASAAKNLAGNPHQPAASIGMMGKAIYDGARAALSLGSGGVTAYRNITTAPPSPRPPAAPDF